MEAFERKVRPIYDALDARNWKGATKLANSALQKFKNNPLIKTLKAVALDRGGKGEEAFQICEEVRSTVPTDDHILHTLCIVYRSTGNLHCLTQAYAAACEKEPKNFELLQGLFGCYVREGIHAKQQQVAMKIYKHLGSEKYLWWVVVSLLLQAWGEPAGVKAPMGVQQTLKLAESMITRQLNTEQKLSTKEALLLYIDILHVQGKPESVLGCLRGELRSLCGLTRDAMQLEAQCHLRMGNWREAADKFKEMLEEQPDDFLALEGYLDCVLPGSAKGFLENDGWMEVYYESCQLTRRLNDKSEEPRPVDSEQNNIEEATELVDRVVELLLAGRPPENGSTGEEGAGTSDSQKGPSLNSKRCAKLVKLELTARKVKLGLSEETDVVDCLLSTFRDVGHLGSCSADVREYPALLNGDNRRRLAADLLADECFQKDDFDSLKACLTAHQIVADLDFPTYITAEDHIEAACKCRVHFVKSLPYLENLDKRELGPVDNVMGVAVSALMSAQRNSPENAVHVWQALAVAVTSTADRPFNPRLNLDLCAIYGCLGAPLLALECMDRLEVKYIQLDSLASHLLLPILLGCRRQKESRRLLIETIQLFEDHKKDAGETVFTAYQKGTFTKIIEFLGFKETLELSHSYYVALAEEGLLRLCECTLIRNDALAQLVKDVCSTLPIETMDDAHLERLRFNEDLDSRARWFPPTMRSCNMGVCEWWEGWGAGEQKDWPETSRYRSNRKKRLRHRWLLPHILKGMMLLGDAEAANKAMVTVLSDSGVALEGCVEHYANLLKESAQRSVSLLDLYESFQMLTLLACSSMASSIGTGGEPDLKLLDLYVDWCNRLVDLICERLSEGGASTCGVEVVAAAILNEDIPWLGFSLQFWVKELLSQKKQARGKSPSICKHVGKIVTDVSQPLEKLVQQLEAMSESPVDNSSLLAAMSEGQGWKLWEHANEGHVKATLDQVVEEQRESRRRFCERGRFWCKSFSALKSKEGLW
ncbi:hypothetical protein BSKO_00465 [Bryopsis sp. KO-2023]|nr:hypothetical protein BSKO_00465 [Bryopsis sp. KO-2023]